MELRYYLETGKLLRPSDRASYESFSEHTPLVQVTQLYYSIGLLSSSLRRNVFLGRPLFHWNGVPLFRISNRLRTIVR